MGKKKYKLQVLCVEIKEEFYYKSVIIWIWEQKKDVCM